MPTSTASPSSLPALMRRASCAGSTHHCMAVGGSLVERVVEACRFSPAHVVSEQAEPDPRFPTVAFRTRRNLEPSIWRSRWLSDDRR